MRVLLSIAFAILATLLHPLNTSRPTKTPFQEVASKSYKLISHETHDRVLDLVFPRSQARGELSFILRFKPSGAPESQIVVMRGYRTSEILEYTSNSGNIYRRLNGIKADGGKEDPVEMAKLIDVRKRSIKVPIAQFKHWHTSLLNSIEESLNVFQKRSEEAERGTATIALDGTFYDLWYSQGSSHMSFSIYDHEVSNREITGDLLLVQWMNTVRRDVEKLK